MIRWATIVARSPQWVDLQLIKQPGCQGCTGQCHRPLLKLFSFDDNHFRIYRHEKGVHFVNPHLLFSEDSSERQVGQQVGMQMNDSTLLSGGFQFYVLPLLVMIAAMTGGHFMAVQFHLPTDVGAFCGLLLAILWVLLRFKIKQHKPPPTLPKVTIL